MTTLPAKWNLVIGLMLAALQLHGAPQPRIVTLSYDADDLVPVISYDVTAPPYSADRFGNHDATRAIQAALDNANETGGTVFMPPGRYRLNGTLTIPAGVTLRGDFKKPTEEDRTVDGTILMSYANRGKGDGRAFITIEEGGLRDVSIFYPEQSAEDIVPYPMCVNLKGNSSIKNVNLVNPYQGIQTGSFSTVINVYGTPLDIGVIMLHAAAVPRCNGIRFSPHYWSESGLAGAPAFGPLRQAINQRQAHAIQLNRQDAGIFIDIEISHYPTGVKVMPPHGWTYWHDVQILHCEVGFHFTGGSNHRVNLTGSAIAAKRYCILMQMDKTDWKDSWKRHSKSGRPFGTRRDSAELRMFGCKFASKGTIIYQDASYNQKVDLQECLFHSWGSGDNDFAILSDGGRVDVYDSYFTGSERHLNFKGDPKALTFRGNKFSGSPDLKIAKRSGATIDHTPAQNSKRTIRPLRPVPNYRPARTGEASLYVVTSSPYNAPNDGEGDASAAIQRALNKAGRDGGGTVYLPQGRYRITRHLTVPSGVELRGINDFMPRGRQVRAMLIADIPADRGKPDNPPLISLRSGSKGGSGVTGLTFWYPHQDFRDIQPYPWTIRSLGPACWVKRIYLGNCYNAVDFATHNSDWHVLSRINGSALNIGLMVGNSKNIGWIDNCHIRPQDWSISTGKGLTLEFPGDNKPTKQDIFRGTKYSLIPNMRGAGAITIGSRANEQITGYFTNGSTRAFDFIDHDGGGGGSANILIGGSEAGWGAWVKELGEQGVTFVNFSFNPMTRLPYVTPDDIPDGQLPKGLVMRIDPTISKKTPIDMIISKFYGRGEVDLGFEVLGGSLWFKQMEQEHSYRKGAIELKGGEFYERNISMGSTIDEDG